MCCGEAVCRDFSIYLRADGEYGVGDIVVSVRKFPIVGYLSALVRSSHIKAKTSTTGYNKNE